MITLLVSFAIVMSSLSLKAQKPYDRDFLNAELSGGYARNITALSRQCLVRNGFGGYLRLMWNPAHPPAFGLESGFLELYSTEAAKVTTDSGNTSFSAFTTDVPISKCRTPQAASGSSSSTTSPTSVPSGMWHSPDLS